MVTLNGSTEQNNEIKITFLSCYVFLKCDICLTILDEYNKEADTMNILIIEDELKTANFLQRGLVENGFSVHVTHDGFDGLHSAMELAYDLLIIDIMLPKLDGWGVVEKLRQADKQVPILILTACDEIDERVKGLELGADDYLIKPFAFSELLARVKSLLRRGQNKQIETIEVADLKINPLKRKVQRGNSKINLTSKEYNLLVLLALNQGALLTRTYIIEKIWGINFDTDTNIIDVLTRRLRQKIDHGYEVKLIHTIRGAGYVLEDKTQTD